MGLIYLLQVQKYPDTIQIKAYNSFFVYRSPLFHIGSVFYDLKIFCFIPTPGLTLSPTFLKCIYFGDSFVLIVVFFRNIFLCFI